MRSSRSLSVLGRWAARSPLHDPTLPLSAASLMLSFKTMFDASRAKGLNARIGFRIGDETFLVHIHGGACEAARQSLDGADVVFAGPATAIAAAVYGGAPLEALEAKKALAIEGDRALANASPGSFRCRKKREDHAALARLSKSPRPSVPPTSASMRFSGCGIRPSTLRPSE